MTSREKKIASEVTAEYLSSTKNVLQVLQKQYTNFDNVMRYTFLKATACTV